MSTLIACAGIPAQEPVPEPAPQARPVNRLADATSPYLLQHRHNPVDWYPWGPEALAKAKELDKPIFLSIGYAACHWCHVMERESFEDERIAALMNEFFVCIKVDREERPDLDEIYMAAVQGITGHGGWPMSVWLTPELEPFYAGTYFPPTDGRGMPGFDRVCRYVHTLWTERRDLVADRAGKIGAALREGLAPVAAPDDPSFAHLDALAAHSATRFDAEHGGFGQPERFAPKFPHAAELQVLLAEAARTGDERTLAIVTRTLGAMADGGIHDQLAGGFHRYSTDREWLVPHFEKMLYDNAQLAQVYADAWRATREPRWREVVVDTLDHLIRDMQDPAGGFWSTTDADSEGVEGKYFVWSAAEIDAALGDDAPAFRRHYGVTPEGNWEGHNVLHVARPLTAVAAELDVPLAEVEAAVARGRAALLRVRGGRVPPATDDKVLAAWNGMAIAAMAEGYQITGDARYLEAGRRAAAFVLDAMRDERGRLFRSWRRGDARLAGYLEDHAFVADGLLRLFECDGEPRWLVAARDLLRQIDDHFGDDADGNWFFTADDHERLLARSKSVAESSQPSGIAMTVLAHLRAGLLLGDEALWERGVRGLRANHAVLSTQPYICPGLLRAADFALGDPREVVVVGDGAVAVAMREAAWRAWPARRVVIPVDPSRRDALEAVTSIVAGKVAPPGEVRAFVCRRGACDAPVADPAELRLD